MPALSVATTLTLPMARPDESFTNPSIAKEGGTGVKEDTRSREPVMPWYVARTWNEPAASCATTPLAETVAMPVCDDVH